MEFLLLKKENLEESIYVATKRTINDIRYSWSITKEELKDLKIEILILWEGKVMSDYSLFEPWVHGISFENNFHKATFYNTVAIEKNYSNELDDLGRIGFSEEEVVFYYRLIIQEVSNQFFYEGEIYRICEIFQFVFINFWELAYYFV